MTEKYPLRAKRRNHFGNSFDDILIKYREQTFYCCITLLLICFFALQGCGGEFQPIRDNDKYIFTMYGYLDASADTQKVRISPSRSTIETFRELPEMSVKMEHLETGTVSSMNNILVKLPEGFNAINSWSSMDIEPGEKYSLTAERPDGKRSRVTVTIPEDFPTPEFIEDNSVTRPRMNRVLVKGIDHLAGFQTRWYIRLSAPGFRENKMYTFHYRNEAERPTGYSNSFSISFSEELEFQQIERNTPSLQNGGSIEVLHKQVFIAAAGPGWVEEINIIGDLEYGLPEGLSNVENGLGYVVGIISKIIPYKNCTDEIGNLTGCPEEKPFW